MLGAMSWKGVGRKNKVISFFWNIDHHGSKALHTKQIYYMGQLYIAV